MYKRLILVVILAGILRFYQLGATPPSINWDEASNGYNAYSLIKTGRDENGNFLPLYNKSFGDFKPPIYMYLNVISVKLFGLNEFSVRLPSAILGTAAVLIFFLLILRITGQQKLSLIATYFLAISPWNVHFSRVGFESNIGLFFGLSAFALLLLAIPRQNELPSSKSKILLVLSAVALGLSFYSYHSARVFVPLMLLATLFIFRKALLKFSKPLIATFMVIPILIILPFFIFSPSDAIKGRYSAVSLGAQKESTDEYIKFVSQDGSSWISKYIHERHVLLAREYLNNYLAHFNPEFLFVTGDRNLRHHTEGSGMLPMFFLPLVLAGIYKMLDLKNKTSILLLSWLVISPLPAAPADAAPHAVRSIFMTIPLSFAAATGTGLFESFKRFRKVFLILLFCAVIFFTYSYLHNYYFHYSKDKTEFWMYGFREMVAKTESIKDQYPAIHVDASIEQGYIFWLFYEQADPSNYQQLASKPNFDKYLFNSNEPKEGELYVSLADHFMSELVLVDTIYYPNKKEAIKIGRKKYSWEK